MASTYSVSGNSLTLNVGAVTRKMCPGALMDQDSRFLAALPEIRTGRTQDGMLYLQGEGGELIFKAAPIKE
jgi:heat shock protein HslJ